MFGGGGEGLVLFSILYQNDLIFNREHLCNPILKPQKGSETKSIFSVGLRP